ncbi:MAG: hypothetical protein NTZ59_09765, partial [Bacteroidetes bacterium]|nr:hypothetical protein [Bacteroidota bacterium]
MMKLYRYILLVGVIVLGGSVNGQKSCSSGILTNGSFEFCSGSSLKIYVNNDTANTKYFYQWYTGNYPALT